MNKKNICDHCGDVCIPKHIVFDEKNFCCNGCKAVYSLLNEAGLDAYYSFEQTPGISANNLLRENKFSYLDDIDVQNKLIQYSDENRTRITLNIPQIHCSSCFPYPSFLICY